MTNKDKIIEELNKEVQHSREAFSIMHRLKMDMEMEMGIRITELEKEIKELKRNAMNDKEESTIKKCDVCFTEYDISIFDINNLHIFLNSIDDKEFSMELCSIDCMEKVVGETLNGK